MPLGPCSSCSILPALRNRKVCPRLRTIPGLFTSTRVGLYLFSSIHYFLKNNLASLGKHSVTLQPGGRVPPTQSKNSNQKRFSIRVSHWVLWDAAGFQFVFMADKADHCSPTVKSRLSINEWKEFILLPESAPFML